MQHKHIQCVCAIKAVIIFWGIHGTSAWLDEHFKNQFGVKLTPKAQRWFVMRTPCVTAVAHGNQTSLHDYRKIAVWKKKLPIGWRGGSIGRASDSKSKGPRFKSRPEHNKNKSEFFLIQKLCADSLSVCPTPTCIHRHKNDHVRTVRSCSPRQSSVDYGNTKRPSMHWKVELALRTMW